MGRSNCTVATVRPAMVPAMCPAPLSTIRAAKITVAIRTARDPRSISGVRSARPSTSAASPVAQTSKRNSVAKCRDILTSRLLGGPATLVADSADRHLSSGAEYHLNIRMSLVACQTPVASRATGRIATTSEDAL
jgi:hypothetical protein